MKCRDRKLGESDYYNKHNFEMIFEQNAQHNNETGFAVPIVRGISDFARFIGGNAELQAVFDGFMLGDVDFEGMPWKEIEDTLARLRREAETRKARAMANQAEVERNAVRQEFGQAVALLDELERWLVGRKVNHNTDVFHYDYDQEEDTEMES